MDLDYPLERYGMVIGPVDLKIKVVGRHRPDWEATWYP